MKLSVSETSKLMGVSVRTLHYYDEIGLLKPSEKSEAGYRFYDEKNLAVLQQILFYRELELPLKEIVHILSQPDHDQKTTLTSHRELLLLKRRHIEDLLSLVDETLGGNENMSKGKFAFADYEEAKDKYTAEVKARWGQTKAYRESEEKNNKRTPDETAAVMNEAGGIFEAFAGLRYDSPDDPKVQTLVKRWQAFITDNFYACTDEMLSSLGEMYVTDSRFTENIDRCGEGTAQFMSEAIKVYCASGQE